MIALFIFVLWLFLVGVGYTASPGDVVFNELMWMGSTASTSDEWIELRNTTGQTVDLSGWCVSRMSSTGETLMVAIESGTISGEGLFLISNYDVEDEKSMLAVTSDLVTRSISLPNSRLQLKLYDGAWEEGGRLIDVADDGIGTPAAGDRVRKCAMVRVVPPGDGTLVSSWRTAIVASGWAPGAGELGTPGKHHEALSGLASFSISPTKEGVLLVWRDGGISGNRVWHIYRSSSSHEGFSLVGQVLSAQGTSCRFAEPVSQGDVYFYFVQSLDTEGTEVRSRVLSASSTEVQRVGWGTIKQRYGL